jgi:DNA-binding SARP family transcriptional activator/tetratricopeptide (TPR) repeat protein
MAALRLELLGGLQVLAGAGAWQAVAVPSRKVQALLVVLALERGRPQPRAKLASLLWSDAGEAPSRASLRQALLVLRRTLNVDERTLVIAGETIVLANVEVDAIQFEALAEDGTPAALEQAAALYRGPLCDAFDVREPAFDDWLDVRRQQLRERALAVWSRLLALRTDHGHVEREIDAALHLLALDPLQEGVHRRLMQAYARQGRRGAALRQFQLCRDLLAREVGTRPQAETLALRDAIERAGDSAQPALARSGPTWPADDAELRPVVVLVAEPALADHATDPEAVRAADDRFVATASATAALYGGSAQSRMGAGVTVRFGVQQTHGDDLERAARCALALGAAWPGVHVGLAAGQTLVVRQADGVALAGPVPSQAARLCAAATSGEILVGAATWPALSKHADGQRCEPQGLPQALRDEGAWRLAALQSRAPQAAFVGRRAELVQFEANAQACRVGGAGFCMVVRGDPGIGKSRLVDQFRELAVAHGFACHRATVLDFGSGDERDAVRVLLYALLDATGAPAAAASLPLDELLRRGGLDAADEAPLCDLLHRPMAPAAREVFDALDGVTCEQRQADLLARLLKHCCAVAPRFIAIEDLHWAPARNMRLLAALARAVEHCAALLVMSTRVEGDPLDSAWRTRSGLSALATFDLGPLRWAEASAVASQYRDIADPLTLRCLDRAAGNPLFLEQLLQAGRQAGDGLPDSLHAVVLARLDRLPASERQRVRVASVLGQRFAVAALAHLLGEAPAPEPPAGQALLRIEGDEGVFSHALIRDGAYASLARALRRDLHARAAQWFAGRDDVLHAEHLALAEDPAAAQAFLGATLAQAARHDHERALQLAERGAALAHDGEPACFGLACARADALHDLGRMGDAQVAYASAAVAAQSPADRCRALLGLATVLRVRDNLPGAAEALAQVERIATEAQLAGVRSRLHFVRGNLLFPRGDLAGCRREHELSLALAREAGDVELEVASLGGLGDAAFLQGRMLSAREHFEHCVALAARHGWKRVEAANRPMAAISRWYAGQTHAAALDALEAITLARRIGHHRAEMIGHHGAYETHHALADFDAARAHADQALALARRIDAPRFEAEGLAFQGELLRTIGRRADAVDKLQQALSIARATGIAFIGPLILGMLSLATDDEPQRAAALAEGEALLAGNGLAHNHLHFRRDAIDACAHAGDAAGVLHHAAALEAFTEAEPLPWSTFHVALARALATPHGDHSALREQAREMGLMVALNSLLPD